MIGLIRSSLIPNGNLEISTTALPSLHQSSTHETSNLLEANSAEYTGWGSLFHHAPPAPGPNILLGLGVRGGL